MLSHIFLHVGLCNAIAQAPPDAVIAMHLTMAYRVGGDEIDKTVRFARGDGAQTVVEFDVRRSVYKLTLDVPKYRCATSDFVDVLADQNRTLVETLADGPPAPPEPMAIFAGEAPQSFLYVKPTFVAFDPGLACDRPIQPPVPVRSTVEYDQGSFYVWLYEDPQILAHGPLTIALRLRTTTGLAHYVKVPLPFPQPWGGWPSTTQFNVTEEMIDAFITDKTDVLLCPKIWETSAG